MTTPQHLYLKHFGLKEAPFKITPTTDFFYGGGRRGEILHALRYAINVGEGIIMVTGEVGSGKTMMLRTLLQKLDDNVDIIYIANPSLSGREILYHICEDLGLHVKENRPDTVRLLQSELIERHGKKRKVIAFIDEAQAMPDESLEEIRLLSNLETSRDKLLQIALFGQPELEEKISSQSMRQLRERITVKLKLYPFGRDDIQEYIATRLRVAGYNGPPMFSKEACRLIANVSQGLSRRINVLADKAMLSASSRGSLTVSYADARRAVKEVNFGKMEYRTERTRRFSKRVTALSALSACLLLFVAAGWYLINPSPATINTATVAASDGGVTREEAAEEAAEEMTTALPESLNGNGDYLDGVTQFQTTTASPESLNGNEAAAWRQEAVAETAEAAETAEEVHAEASWVPEKDLEVAFAAADAGDKESEPLLPTEKETAEENSGVVAIAAQEEERRREEDADAAVVGAQAVAPALPVIVVTQTVMVKNVVVSATASPSPPPLSPAEKRREILNAIKTHASGAAALSGEQLARQLRENAEPQTNPQSGGGEHGWQENGVAAVAGGGDDSRWNWMPASSYLRNRLNATQAFFEQGGVGGRHTARLLTVAQDRAVFLERLLRYFADFYPVRNIMIYPISLESGDKFVVTYGIYETADDANVFLSNVPYYFTGGRPFAQRLSDSLRETRY